MANSKIYTILSGLNETDRKIYSKLSSLDKNVVHLSGYETISGDLGVKKVLVNQSYAFNVASYHTTNTPVDTVIYTKIKWVSSAVMPLVRIYGYAYGQASPIELRVVFYIYQDEFTAMGVSSTGAWKPDVYGFKYTSNGADYVAIGLKGAIYYVGFQVDCQVGAMQTMTGFSSNYILSGWTVSARTSGEVTASGNLTPAVGTDKCKQFSYKTMKTDIEGSATKVSKSLTFDAATDTVYDGSTAKTIKPGTGITFTTSGNDLTIATTAEANQNAFSNVKIDTVTISATTKTDTLELVPGDNIQLSADTANKKVTIKGFDGIHNVAIVSSTAANNTTKLAAFVSGTISDGSISGTEEPYDGMVISFKKPLNGGDYGFGLKLNNGNMHPIAYNAASKMTSHLANGTYGLLVYNAAQTATIYLTAGTSTTVTGVWQWADYYSNSYTMYSEYDYGYNYTPLCSISGYQLVFLNKEHKLIPLTNSPYTTASSKIYTTEAFNPFARIYYHNSGSTRAAGTLITGQGILYPKLISADIRYPINCTTTTFTKGKDVYAVCKPLTDGQIRLVSSSAEWSGFASPPGPFTQNLPTSEDGLLYLRVCTICYDNASRFAIDTTHPVYQYKNGGLQLYTGTSQNAEIAEKLGTATVGGTTTPIYLSAGVPTALGYTIAKSVPSDAKFTDTVYTHPDSAIGTGLAQKLYKLGFNKTGHVSAATEVTSGDIMAYHATITSKAQGLYKVGYDTHGHISGTTAVTSADITALGITNYTHPTYTSKTAGLYKITVDGTGHISATAAVTSAEISGIIPKATTSNFGGIKVNYTTSNQNIKVQLDTNGNAYIIHPTTTSKATAFYKVGIDTLGHVSGLTAVTSGDITALGITNYTHPTYTSKTSNIYKITVDGTGHVSAATAVTSADIKSLHPTYTAHAQGLYKIGNDATGHVSGITAVTSSDITALGIPSSDTVYTHPSYTSKSSGLYKITVDGTGHISATAAVTSSDISTIIPKATTSNFGGIKINYTSSGQNLKVTLDSSGNAYAVHPSGTNKATGFYKIGVDSLGHVSAATAVTSSDITSLVTLGEINQNAFSNVKVENATISANAKTDTLEFVPGDNIQLSADTTNKKVTIKGYDGIHNITVVSSVAATNKVAALITGTVDDGVLSSGQEPYDGMTISFKKPRDGDGTYGYGLKLNNGNFHPITYNKNWKMISHLPTDCYGILVYNSTVSASIYLTSNVATNVYGVWQWANYYSDTNAYTIYDYYASYIPLSTIYGYQLTVINKEEKLVPITNTAYTTNTNKVYTTEEFNPFGKMYYHRTDTTRTAGTLFRPDGTLYTQTLSTDVRYICNCTTSTFVREKELYMVCKPLTNGQVRLVSSATEWSGFTSIPGPFTQDLPTSEDGLVYIRVGKLSSTAYNLNFDALHPAYQYKNNGIQLYTGTKDPAYSHPTYTNKAQGLYKVGVDTLGHVSGTTAVTSADITALGITNYSLPLAASGTRGGIQIGYSESGNNYAVKLSSEKAYVTIPSASTAWGLVKTGYTTSNQNIKVQLDTSGNAYIVHPTTTSKATGLYKVGINTLGHVSGLTTVTSADITALGIPSSDTVYTHPTYTSKTSNIYKITVDGTGHVSAATAVTSADIKSLHPTYTAHAQGLYKVGNDGYGHVSGVTAVTSADITALGITNYTHPTTTSKATAFYKVGINTLGHVSGLVAVTSADITALGINNYTHPTYTAHTQKLYKIGNDGTGHVSGVTEVTSADITALGITNYTHPSYTNKTQALYKVGVDTLGHVSGVTAVTSSDLSSIIPKATTSNFGGIKINYTTSNQNIKVQLDTNGNAYIVHPTTTSKATAFYKVGINTLGHVSGLTTVTSADITALGITNYTHPTYTSKASNIYKITVDGTGHVSAATAVTSADIKTLHPTYTAHAQGLYKVGNDGYGHVSGVTAVTSADIVALGISGEANQNAFSNIKIDSITISANAKTDTLELEAGDNIQLSADTTNKKVAIKGYDGVHRVTVISSIAANTTTKVATLVSGSITDGSLTGTQEPYDGMVISLKKPKDGNSTYGFGLKLNDGNFHPLVYNLSGKMTSHLQNNVYGLFVYNAAQTATIYLTANTVTTVTGVWQWGDYDSNTNTLAYSVQEYYVNYIPLSAIQGYTLVLQNKEGKLVPLSNSAYTSGTTKVYTTSEFSPFGKVYYYNSTATKAAGSIFSGDGLLYNQYISSDARYLFNAGATTLTKGKDVYLVCMPLDNGQLRLVSSATEWSGFTTPLGPVTQDLPTSEDGLVYMRVGCMVQNSQVKFQTDAWHPSYVYDAGLGSVQLYTGSDCVGKKLAQLKTNIEQMVGIIKRIK